MTRGGTIYDIPLPWWRRRRNVPCRYVDPETFFPEHGDARTTAMARRVCQPCRFRLICLEYVLEYERPGDRYGVWAGTTPGERTREAKRRARAERDLATLRALGLGGGPG